MQPKGKTMLKVVGILYIIFSAISVVMGLIALAGGAILGGAVAGAIGDAGAAGVAAGLGLVALLGALLILVDAALGLVAGILGVKNCDQPQKANVCFVLGVILVVLSAISLISTISSHGNVFSGLIGLVLPILYTVGAYQVKSSAAAPAQGYGAPQQPYVPQQAPYIPEQQPQDDSSDPSDPQA